MAIEDGERECGKWQASRKKRTAEWRKKSIATRNGNENPVTRMQSGISYTRLHFETNPELHLDEEIYQINNLCLLFVYFVLFFKSIMFCNLSLDSKRASLCSEIQGDSQARPQIYLSVRNSLATMEDRKLRWDRFLRFVWWLPWAFQTPKFRES